MHNTVHTEQPQPANFRMKSVVQRSLILKSLVACKTYSLVNSFLENFFSHVSTGEFLQPVYEPFDSLLVRLTCPEQGKIEQG